MNAYPANDEDRPIFEFNASPTMKIDRRSKLIPASLSIALLITSLSASADDCENFIKMDGLFSKAQRECPFSYYAYRFHQHSLMCAEKTGEAKWKQLFSQGASTFDGKAASMGKSALCNKLVKDFPMTVKF